MTTEFKIASYMVDKLYYRMDNFGIYFITHKNKRYELEITEDNIAFWYLPDYDKCYTGEKALHQLGKLLGYDY
jgi:hypothetical protein